MSLLPRPLDVVIFSSTGVAVNVTSQGGMWVLVHDDERRPRRWAEIISANDLAWAYRVDVQLIAQQVARKAGKEVTYDA